MRRRFVHAFVVSLPLHHFWHLLKEGKQVDASELSKHVSDALSGFMKTGPVSNGHIDDVLDSVTDIVARSIVSVEEAVDSYRQVCDKFMVEVIAVKGMPLRAVVSEEAVPAAAESEASHSWGTLLPKIQDRNRFCIENFQRQAEKCSDEEIVHFRDEVAEFLRLIPAGGTKDKELKARISTIKKTIKFLAKWNRLFYTYKAMSFPAEVEYIFSLQDDPIAAEWHFSALDDQCDFRMEHDHRALNSTIYLVRNSWAMEKSYLDKDSAPYIDDVVRPMQDIGCMCNLRWLYNLRDLPSHFLSSYGQKVFEQTRVR